MSDGINRSELLSYFFAEADEQLLVLEQQILKLEQNGESPEIIQTIFRAAHTLKGSSAAMGFEEMKRLTHEMENILDKIRHQQLPVTGQVVNVLFQCLDHLTDLKTQIINKGNCNSNIEEIVSQLQQLAHIKQHHNDAKQAVTALPLTEQQRAALCEAESQGLHCWLCEVTFSADCDMKAARTVVVRNHLAQLATVVAAYPPLEAIEEGDIASVFYYIISTYESGEIMAKISQLMDVEQVDLLTLRNGELHKIADNEKDRPVTTGKAEPAKKKEEFHKVGQTIRVDVDRLEHLMNLVGELVIDQTRIAQVGTVLRDLVSADDTLDELDQISNHVNRVVGELQESVMKTRMLPIEQLFNRFPRMVRDLTQALNKDINFIVEGRETELDRTVIEEIGDPLIHLIRNAIDHGIEEAEVREAAGKPAKGTIRVKANHEENQVVLTIEDDGAGVDAEKIKQSAIRKELITSQQADAMTEQELIHLIFLPGFSTAKVVSDISGRGVGMDIVRNHIEKLNGLIDVETHPGQGTKFTVKLPLTLAIVRGLLINLKATTFALPMSSVVEIMRLPRKEINSIKGQAVVKVRDKVLPLIWLHDHFKMSHITKRANNVFIVVVGAAEKRLALVVDELIGNQEIVVKSMGAYVGKIEGVSGATILGDGSVALILDVTGVFRMVGKDRPASTDEAERAI